MKIILTFLISFLNLLAIGQTDCKCGKFYGSAPTNPDSIIKINGIETFAICGYFENDFISEFTITKCGEEEVIDFFGATLKYKIEVDKDTLKLVDYRYLLTDDLENFANIPWAVDMYFYSNNKLIHEREITYTKDKNIVLNEEFQNEWNEEIRDDWSTNDRLIAWTFLISLDNENNYKKYFEKYRTTFKIGGAHAEYYNELKELYLEYQNKNCC